MARDPFKYFRIEAHEIVRDLGKGLLDLEHGADVNLVSRLLRLAHTLKGAARIVRHRELADLSHALEEVLGPLRDAPVPQRLDAGFAIVDQMTGQLAGLAAPVVAPDPGAASPTSTATHTPGATHVESAAIDDMLGGLANAHAMVGRLRAVASDSHTVSLQIDQLDRELREVRKDVEQLRLSSAGGSFAALERTARDAALGAGKRVRFSAEGAEVRIDAPVLATLHGALVQLVRNAVAHGIELPAQRAAAGKPAEGSITITVKSLGARLSITCEDDGSGLDLEAIRRAAHRRGVVAAEELDAARLFSVLLRGGITTSREVTELAGRGIGLDVVREAAHRYGGEVTVMTRTGAGTAISIVVPVSVTAISVLDVEAGGRTAAIPRVAIRQVSRLGAEQLVIDGDSIRLAFDDVEVPYAALASLLGRRAGSAETAIMIDSADGVIAVGVERVLGFDEAVVRAPPLHTPIDPIVTGFALDARGHPYPVLDARILAETVRRARRATEIARPRPLPILVVDDSLTTRMLEQSILESAGFEVELAASAEEALDRLAHHTFALVLADVEMPGMDGFALIAELRSRPAFARLPAILISSRDAPADRERGLRVGAQAYIVKSQFDQIALLALIRTLVAA